MSFGQMSLRQIPLDKMSVYHFLREEVKHNKASVHCWSNECVYQAFCNPNVCWSNACGQKSVSHIMPEEVKHNKASVHCWSNDCVYQTFCNPNVCWSNACG
jgi:hypothetical protein